MSSTSTPFGLKPAWHPSGNIRPDALSIATGYTSTIYQYQPVKIVADGTIEAAAVNDRFVGSFQGVEWTDTDGKRRVSNKWTASTAGTDIVAYVTTDPQIRYQMQGDETMTAADIGEQYDFTAASGNATTGLSTQALDVSSTATNAAVQVLNVIPGPDNAWGDSYPVVEVRISEHQFVADIAAF